MTTNKREYDNAYYQANKEKRKAQIRERNLIAIDRNRSNLRDYLQDKICTDCGHRDWRVLQFDHVDPSSKRSDIAKMVGTAYSWQAILDEIAKCEIVCANCHIIRTGITFGFHRFALIA